MKEASTGKTMDRTEIQKLRNLTDEELDSAIQTDTDSLLLEDFDVSTLKVVMPQGKKAISLRIDPDVLTYFKSWGKGYQTRMNAILRAYMEADLKRH
jgi:uncharacterized protein (DUF4415 family)